MSEALTTTRTPEVIAAEIRAYSAQALTSLLEIGRRMKEAKSLLPYGEFGQWVEAQCGYKRSSANNLMRLFEEYGEKQSSLFGTDLECQTFGNLNYSQALALLALPAEERENFVESHDMESLSIRQLKEEIAKLKDDNSGFEQALRETNTEREALEQKLSAAKAEIKELQERPVDVAVAEPDPAMIEDAVNRALAEAQATYDKELQLVKNQFAQKQRELDTALAAKSDAEKAAKKAEKAKERAESQRNAEVARAEEANRRAAEAEKNAGGEAEKLKAELERVEAEKQKLEKQIAMSGENMALFKERFFTWQTDWGKMREALVKLDDGTADKSKQAVIAQLKRWLGELGIRVE